MRLPACPLSASPSPILSGVLLELPASRMWAVPATEWCWVELQPCRALAPGPLEAASSLDELDPWWDLKQSGSRGGTE